MFSVVIPVWNKRPHIERALRSVLAQTLQPFEIIVVDDASTDGSADVIASYADSRIRVLRRAEPGPGGYAARNLGIQKAKGEWVAFLDADDEWYPDHLSSLACTSRAYPTAHFLSASWEYATNSGQTRQQDAAGRRLQAGGARFLTAPEYLALCNAGAQPTWTSVVALRRHALSGSTFPEHRGLRRGGDLVAWLTLVVRHGGLAWSNHVGALYHQDSVNKVTRIEPSNPFMWCAGEWQRTAPHVNANTRAALRRYFGRAVVRSTLAMRLAGQRPPMNAGAVADVLRFRIVMPIAFLLAVPAPVLRAGVLVGGTWRRRLKRMVASPVRGMSDDGP